MQFSNTVVIAISKGEGGLRPRPQISIISCSFSEISAKKNRDLLDMVALSMGNPFAWSSYPKF